MSARETVYTRNGARVTAVALCQWERTSEGGLRATWRPGRRVAPTSDTGRYTGEPAVRLTGEGPSAYAASGSGGTRQRPIGHWLASGFVAALYLLVAFAGIAIVVQA
jgi:hypothetical protein